MSARLYETYKAKHDSIKPIRGKTVRPIGSRRKLQEQIREVVVDGVKGIALRLYNTDCVTYLENGNILLSSGGYNTQTTQKFIHAHSHLRCNKQYNHLWVYIHKPGYEEVAVPLPTDGKPLLLEAVEGSEFHRIVFPEPLLKRSVDKAKAKEARAPLMPFLNWAKAMLTLSDGFVAYDGIGMNGFHLPDGHPFNWRSRNKGNTHEGRYKFLCSRTEEQYLETLHMLARLTVGVYNFSTDGAHVDFTALKNYIYRVTEQGANCHTYIPVKLGPRPIKDLS